MCTYLIIEPNQSNTEKIKSVFDQFPEFKYLGNRSDISSSLEIIYKECPKLIFLNLDESDNPFQHIHEIKQMLDNPPEFIGLSTSKDFAYKALKNNFFDYLTKPLNELDIRKLALKFKKKCFSNQKHKKNICLKSYKDYHYIDTEKIVVLKADNNTTDFHMVDGSTIIAFKTLKVFENILPSNFIRIHKSYIINMDYVNRINYGKNNCSLKEFQNKIPFTKTYIHNIDKLIDNLTESSVYNLN